MIGETFFKLNWKPISSPSESTGTQFTGDMANVVEQLHIIRENSYKSHQKISIEELMRNFETVASKTVSFGEKIFNHFHYFGASYSYGLRGFVLVSLFISYYFLYLKKCGNDSSLSKEKGNSIA